MSGCRCGILSRWPKTLPSVSSAPALGLELGGRFTLADLGPFYAMFILARDLESALRYLSRFQSAWQTNTVLEFRARKRGIGVSPTASKILPSGRGARTANLQWPPLRASFANSPAVAGGRWPSNSSTM